MAAAQDIVGKQQVISQIGNFRNATARWVAGDLQAHGWCSLRYPLAAACSSPARPPPSLPANSTTGLPADRHGGGGMHACYNSLRDSWLLGEGCIRAGLIPPLTISMRPTDCRCKHPGALQTRWPPGM